MHLYSCCPMPFLERSKICEVSFASLHIPLPRTHFCCCRIFSFVPLHLTRNTAATCQRLTRRTLFYLFIFVQGRGDEPAVVVIQPITAALKKKVRMPVVCFAIPRLLCCVLRCVRWRCCTVCCGALAARDCCAVPGVHEIVFNNAARAPGPLFALVDDSPR